MSVQLIVYPQSFQGQFNPLSGNATEFVVNGLKFVGLNSTTSTDATGTPTQLLMSNPPSIVNTWYRFRSTSSGTPSMPTESNGDLVLDSTTTYTAAGVYQKLSNLTIGQQYTFTITTGTTGTGNIYMRVFDGNFLFHTGIGLASAAQVTSTFTATAPDNTVMISYENTVVDNITIRTISLNPQGVTPNLTTFGLQNGQVICDLYEDEDIPLSLSVDDFKNAAEKVQSYSKAFNLPATKRNNQIFDNMFEITRTAQGNVSFNPYVKTNCILKQDGFILFQGYLRMLDVTDKDGEISYNVNLYSEAVALADVLKDRTFSDLDFKELEHQYNKNNIRNSWNDAGTGITFTHPATSGYRDAYSTVKYPFVNWNNQIILADNPAGVAGPTHNLPQLPSLENAFRPFINIKYLIDRIFQATPFTWESTFFDSTDFGKLYMDFNWGSENAPVFSSTTSAGTYISDGSSLNYGNNSPFFIENLSFFGASNVDYNTTNHRIECTSDNTEYFINYMYQIRAIIAGSGITYTAKWVLTRASGSIEEIDIRLNEPIAANSVDYWSGNFSRLLNNGDVLQAVFEGDSSNVVYQQFDTASVPAVTPTSTLNVTKTELSMTSGLILQTLRGELGQWDFIKGIMTMFNLVSMPDEDNPNKIKFEPYGDIFLNNANSVQHNWSDKIDVSEMKLTPLTELNKNTIFKFVEDDDDFAFTNYKNQVGGHLYGSQKYDASTASNGFPTILQDTEEIVAQPFAATVVKPLMEQFPEFITPAVYAMTGDVSEGFDNSPRIMYNNGIKDTGVTYYIPAQAGLTSENQANILQFSHLTTIPTDTGTQDFHFGECQLIPPVGASVPDNLFNLYWLPYFSELYNPDTRTMTIKVNLSPSDINTFKFSDTVMIKNREFRVNKIDYKPNDLATVEFILIP